jgi:MarR family transcriptional regulator, organic hydroperoxide resistance regulator
MRNMIEKGQLIEQVIELHRQVDRLFRDPNVDVWIAMNLTRAQLKSLFFISREKETNFTKLAGTLGVTPSNITGIIDRLVKQGLVTRNPNPKDRRIILLRVTGKGEALVADLREHRIRQLLVILENMNPQDLSSLIGAYSALLEAAEVRKKEKLIDDR